MRLTSLVLVLALGCGTPGAELGQEPSAPVAAVEAPAAAPSAAATAQPEDDDFFLGHDDREIVGWDTTARNHGTAMRLMLAPIAPPTTIVPITTSPPITTAPPTTTPAAADADSDGYDTSVDCNDSNSSIYPGAVEVVADGVDQDCDGKEACYADADADGYAGTGTALSTDLDCADAGEFSVADDCLDVGDLLGVLAAAVHPGVAETCNGVDDDCNGTVDDGLVVPSWYQDGDADGYGTGDATVACVAPDSSWADAGGDCADADPDIHPDATDVPGNGVDEDCVGGDATGTEDTDGTPGDTDGPGGDTDEGPGDTGPDDGGDKGGGCSGGGCSTPGAPSPVGFTALAGLLGLVRRRRRS